MKIKKWIVGSCILTACTLSFSQAIQLCHDESDSAPWLLKNGKGLNILLMEEAAAQVGLKITVKALPWRRCLLAIQDKSIDGAIAASFNQERASFAEYPMAGGKPDINRRLHTDEYSLYQAKGGNLKWDGTKFSNLTGMIGAQRGYSVLNDLKNAGAKVDEGGSFPRENVRKIIGGQVQAIALTTQEGDAQLLNPEFAGKIEKISPPFIQKHYYTIIGKDYYRNNQKTVEALWSAMVTIRESKAYQAKVMAAFKNK
jgi:polar amino acid transport system substrate-binding protein